MLSRREFLNQTSAGVLGTTMIQTFIQSCNSPGKMELTLDWNDFLSRHDMLWKRLPTNWEEAPWTGNGMLGSMSWIENNALRLQVFRGDVQAHRPMTQGMSGFTRGRLQIGSFYLKPEAQPIDCDLRLSLYDAEVAGTVKTDAYTFPLLFGSIK